MEVFAQTYQLVTACLAPIQSLNKRLVTPKKWGFPEMWLPLNHPKSSISIGFSLKNQPFWGYLHDYGNPQEMVVSAGRL